MWASVDKEAVRDLVRFLPNATAVGMVIVLVLQIAGRLSAGAGFLDFLILGGIWFGARMITRSWDTGPPER